MTSRLRTFFCGQARIRRLVFLVTLVLVMIYMYLALFPPQAPAMKAGLGEDQQSPFWGQVGRAKDRLREFPSIFGSTADKTNVHPHEGAREDHGKPSASAKTDSSSTAFKPGLALVKKMMEHAWYGYKAHAWGKDELAPLTKEGLSFVGDELSFALTMIDALDTLILMGMEKEYAEARDYVLENVSFNQNITTSLFESNIRIVGGLLGAFTLTGDERLVSKALDLATRYLVNFEGTFPNNQVNLIGHLANPKSGAFEDRKTVMLAEIGTLSLEFTYLSYILKNPVFQEKAIKIIKALSEMETTVPGLYPVSIYTWTQNQPDNFYTIGGMADSFYEYLFKYWVFSGRTDTIHRRMWDRAAVRKNLRHTRNGHEFLIFHRNGKQHMQMEHLACFAGGLFGLAAHVDKDAELLSYAASLTETCYLMYHKQRIGIAPEFVHVRNFKPVSGRQFWILRPEALESIFVMWRVTHDPKYREWGYEMAQNIEKHCRIESGGYVGMENIVSDPPERQNRMNSFFLAETLKYLYLLFSDDSLLNIEEYVFNTEAHPFPIFSADKIPEYKDATQ